MMEKSILFFDGFFQKGIGSLISISIKMSEILMGSFGIQEFRWDYSTAGCWR